MSDKATKQKEEPKRRYDDDDDDDGENSLFNHINRFVNFAGKRVVNDREDSLDLLRYHFNIGYTQAENPEIKQVNVFEYSNYLELETLNNIPLVDDLLAAYKAVVLNISVKSSFAISKNKQEKIMDLYNLGGTSELFENDRLVLFNHYVTIIDMSERDDETIFIVYDSWQGLHSMGVLYSLDRQELYTFLDDLTVNLEIFGFDPYNIFNRVFKIKDAFIYGRKAAITLRENLNLIGSIDVMHIEDSKYEYSRYPPIVKEIDKIKSLKFYADSHYTTPKPKMRMLDIESPSSLATAFTNLAITPPKDPKEEYVRKLKERKKQRRATRSKYEEPISIFDDPSVGIEITKPEIKPMSVPSNAPPPSYFKPYTPGMFGSPIEKPFGSSETSLFKPSISSQSVAVQGPIVNPFASSKSYLSPKTGE